MMNSLILLLAAGGHTPPPLVDIDLTVLVQFVIFLILLFVLNNLVFRPYFALRKERSENIEGAREKAGQLSADAEQKIARYEEQIMSARKEAATSRAQYREAGEAQASQLLQGARSEADAKVEAARAKMAKSVQQAETELQAHAATVARAIASKLLDREV